MLEVAREVASKERSNMKSRRIVVVSVLAHGRGHKRLRGRVAPGQRGRRGRGVQQVKMTLADAIALAERQTAGRRSRPRSSGSTETYLSKSRS